MKGSIIRRVIRSINHKSSTVTIAPILLTLFISGCAIAPGMQTSGLKQQSAIELPSAEGEEKPPEYISVKKIDAKLIIEQEKKRRQEAVLNHKSNIQNKLLIDNYEYRIGPADIISITVWDHPELTIPAGSQRSADQAGNMVSNDGTIYFPYAGVVKIEGKTIMEARNLLTSRLQNYIEDVKMDVRIATFKSKRIYVVGEVGEPGVRNITDIPPTMLEMINRSGGFTKEADRRNVTLTRADKTYRVDLLALYEDGESSQNILLESGDIVNVRDRNPNKVFVLGQVGTPGSYMMHKHRKSLAEALADAGGIDESESDPSQIFVARGSETEPEIYHLNASTPDALLLADRFPLQPRDVVYVETAGIVRWTQVVGHISATLGIWSQANTVKLPLFDLDRASTP